ncbi:MAG: hypothetical protein QM270_07505 [Bacillota bacterium]|nr:hypothetical protein [Bacillota bacterium]
MSEQRWTLRYERLPETVEDFKRLLAGRRRAPEEIAGLFIVAMCRYPADPEAALEMVNLLRGPRPLSHYERQFYRDRMGHDYVPRSFFVGATPANNYTPDEPPTLIVEANRVSYDQEGMARLLMKSGGADSARPIVLRLKPSTGEWFLWEEVLLGGIRPPVAADPWA